MYSFTYSLFPESKCCSFSSTLPLETIPSACSDTGEENDRENNGGEPPDIKKGEKGLWMKGKPLHQKLVLSKNWLRVWDLQVLPTRACVAVVPVATAQNGESFFVECSMLKHAPLPGRKARPSLVWDVFPIDLWFT